MSRDRLQDFGGTFRTRRPDETLRDILPYGRSIGISRVGNVTGLDTIGIPVWMAVRPMARSLTVSQGKGADHDAARVSAAMESIELHHAEHYLAEGEVHTLGTALASDDFVSPIDLPIRVDADFRLSHAVRWVEARPVGDGRPALVPREIIDRDARLCIPKDRLFFSSSNGLASGNTLAEALIHGLSEVVERDQLTFWMIEKEIARPGSLTMLDPATIDESGCSGLVDRLRSAGLRFAIWYASTTIRMPCFACSIWDEDGATFYPQRASGFGCHPYKKVALSRAITEAAQSRLTHISGARDDMFWTKFRNHLPVDGENNRSFIRRAKDEPPAVDYRTIPEAPLLPDPRQMVGWICDVLRREANCPAYYVDLSRPEAPVSVVHVLCPGLEVSVKKDLYTPGARAMRSLGKALDA